MTQGAPVLARARGPEELDAFVLCGGLGTRLRAALPEAPKALAPVGGRPFLEIVLEVFAVRGVRRFVLCAGHRAEAIEALLPALSRFGEVRVSRETRPLGTGGAVRNALPHAARDPLLVANGDSLCSVDLAAMLAGHRERDGWLTIAAVRGAQRADTGNLIADERGRVLRFAEKRDAGSALANAGIYLIDARALAHGPTRSASFSLETELIPALLAGGAYVHEVAGPLLDIGTPERLRGAAAVLREMGVAADG